MLIHTLPPRRMCRVIAIRADSICRLVTYAGSSAWIPYSPKVTWVPPLAAPWRFGWCCLRCLTRRGISMSRSAPLGWCGLGRRRRLGRLRGDLGRRRGGLAAGGALGGRGLPGGLRTRADRCRRRAGGRTGRGGLRPATGGRTVAPAGAAGALVAGPQRGLGRLLLAGHDLVALVDPDLHADPAEGGPGLVEAEVDVGAQRVQRDPALAVELAAAHLGAAEPAAALDPDALRAALHGRLHRLAHRAPEAHPARQLLGDALRDELRVGLRVLHLEDVEVDVLARELLEVAADPVGLRAASADDDARPGGVNVDVHPVTGALDLDPADAGPLHAAGEHPPDGDVF